ncbi:hypothetical protein [Vibrio europaeus]|uniref:hypothetical protein n=1 Tax=Vibrio europaeus TaxID=300876 RepID=UPI00148C316C|nr:hypothetical protein [Vibrio europaeus]NOH22391.1 hypothetical protein [Vibrio europaeus]
MLLMVTPNVVYAKHAIREVTVTQLHPISTKRPASPNSENSTRIYVNPGAWGDTTCRQDAADLLKEDTHLLSILLMAWTTGKNIRIEVDDTITPWGPEDNVCQVTALYIK